MRDIYGSPVYQASQKSETDAHKFDDLARSIGEHAADAIDSSLNNLSACVTMPNSSESSLSQVDGDVEKQAPGAQRSLNEGWSAPSFVPRRLSRALTASR